MFGVKGAFEAFGLKKSDVEADLAGLLVSLHSLALFASFSFGSELLSSFGIFGLGGGCLDLTILSCPRILSFELLFGILYSPVFGSVPFRKIASTEENMKEFYFIDILYFNCLKLRSFFK